MNRCDRCQLHFYGAPNKIIAMTTPEKLTVTVLCDSCYRGWVAYRELIYRPPGHYSPAHVAKEE